MAVRDAIIHFGEVLAKHFGIPAINKTGSTLAKGALVYISGWDSTAKRFKITAADASTPLFATAVLTSQVLTDGATVARPSANVTGLNTAGKTVGDAVYLSTAGTYTYTIPATNIQVLGYVTKVDATDGAIEFDLAYAGAFSSKPALVPTDLAVTGQASTHLAQDDLCYVSSVTAAGVPIMTPADADGAGKAATWICTGTILSGATGLFRKAVLSVATLNTNAGTVGDPVYLTTNGGTGLTWTLTPPSATDAIVQVVGHITVKSVTVGRIMWDLASGSGVKSIGTNEAINALHVTTAGGTAATGSDGTGASGGTAPAFTGTLPTAAVNLAFPAFEGTGQGSAGQVITTTDNQTMTLNQCAGMWFISAEHGPYLIASNTAVAGAPAVLTIYGTAPTTDAGTYKIVAAPIPAGSVASHTHTGPAHTHTGPSHTH